MRCFVVIDLEGRIVRLLYLNRHDKVSHRQKTTHGIDGLPQRRAGHQTKFVRSQPPSYGRLIRSTSTQDVERSTHLTLRVEKLVYDVIQTACCAFDVHPNSFTAASGVEMTRTRMLERSWVSSEIAAKVAV